MSEPSIPVMIDSLKALKLSGWAKTFLEEIKHKQEELKEDLSLRDVTELERLYYTYHQ